MPDSIYFTNSDLTISTATHTNTSSIYRIVIHGSGYSAIHLLCNRSLLQNARYASKQAQVNFRLYFEVIIRQNEIQYFTT